MKNPASGNKVLMAASYIIGFILLLLPFHAFLTVWLASLVGHYTLLRLWKEFLLVLILLAVLYVLLTDSALRRRWFSLLITKLILAYTLLLLLLAFLPYARNEVTAKAMWYGLLVDLRFLIFFLAVVVIVAKSAWLKPRWPKILFAPAIMVAAFAVLQYLVLPYDFLKHFGYGPTTIRPYEAISHTTAHIRVASTLRGANPLGAYLIVPLSALTAFFFKEKGQKLNKAMFGLGLLLALIFSFSRSAWIGAALSVLVVVWLAIKNEHARKFVAWILAGCVVIGALVALALRHNTNFQDIFLHTDHTSKVVTSSNEGHVSAARSAAQDIAHKPFGGGVGTAGPQSVYNNHERIAEDYFLQIGQEAGIVGMLLFIIICIEVGRLLFDRLADPLALALFASLIGVSFVNLLSHAWSDDTLAYIWWGLAGVALAPILMDRQKAHGKSHKT